MAFAQPMHHLQPVAIRRSLPHLILESSPCLQGASGYIVAWHLQVGMRPLAGSEFAQACELLASIGLLDVGRAPEERQRRVQLRVAEDDVLLGINDIRVFQTCLGTRHQGPH